MSDTDEPRYLTRIHVEDAFVVEDLDIEIGDDPTVPRHLILTGPNGSGKSSVLLGLFEFLKWGPGAQGSLPDPRRPKVSAHEAPRGPKHCLRTTAELERLKLLAQRKPAPGTPEHTELSQLADRLSERSHVLALQVRKQLEDQAA